MPTLGCCGGGPTGDPLPNQFQVVRITYYIPDVVVGPADPYWRFTDLDRFIADAYGILAGEAYPGVWSSVSDIIRNKDGTINRTFAGPLTSTLPFANAQFLFRILHVNSLSPPPPATFPPALGDEQLNQVFNQDSRIIINKIRYWVRAPWSSFLGPGVGQPAGTINECTHQLGDEFHDVEIQCTGQSTTTVGKDWFNIPYVSGVRSRQVVAGNVCG